VATLKVEAIFVADIYIDARVALASGRGCVGYGFPEAFMTAKFVGHSQFNSQTINSRNLPSRKLLRRDFGYN